MKIIISESQLNLLFYLKSLDLILKGIELNKKKSEIGYKVYCIGDVRIFTYSERSEDVYFFKKYVDELIDMTSDLSEEKAKEVIKSWIQNKFWYPIRDVYFVKQMSKD
jgi:hypothetical protein